MNVAMLFQVGLNLIFGLGLFVVFKRLNKPAKDDPRLSRGLQLLQSKIAILEDLSDRTEVQVSQLVALMEQKCKDVQSKIQQAERHVHMINTSMEKSLDVAKIFQDKIPHQEIIERQNTLKYVQAARLAHQGMSLDDIRQRIDLPLGELEFIVKVNKSQLMFAEESLPAWAQEPAGEPVQTEQAQVEDANVDSAIVEEDPTEAQFRVTPQQLEPQQEQAYVTQYDPELPPETVFYQAQFEEPNRDLSNVFEVPKPEMSALEKLGEEFRKACQDYEQAQAPEAHPVVAMPEPEVTVIANRSASTIPSNEQPVVRKVEFPRINLSSNLR